MSILDENENQDQDQDIDTDTDTDNPFSKVKSFIWPALSIIIGYVARKRAAKTIKKAKEEELKKQNKK